MNLKVCFAEFAWWFDFKIEPFFSTDQLMLAIEVVKIDSKIIISLP
jgi:hypothetical protein